MKAIFFVPTYREKEGIFRGLNVPVEVVGMGKVDAAFRTALIFAKNKYDLAVLCGVGGGYYESGINIGDIVIAEEEVLIDEGVRYKENLAPLSDYFPRYKLETFNLPYKKGVFNTVSSVSGDRETAHLYYNLSKAICENMEGGSVAHVCSFFKIPLLEIRVISNYAGDRRFNWNTLEVLRDAIGGILDEIKNGNIKLP